MSFPAYPIYQYSGNEWIGVIPDHWSESPLKRVFKIEGGSTPPPDEANWDGDIAWVTPADLSGLSSLYLQSSKRTITAAGLASCGTALLPAGSLILSTRAPIGSLAIAMINMCTNQGCKGLVPKPTTSAAYFAFVLLAAKDELNNRGRGSTFLEISGDELSRFTVPEPPYAEQTQIARFLDHETARIDALIEEQQRLIGLLKEKSQAMISHAVTKGLNPTVPMKDSGVEWLKEVPAHWKKRRLKNISPFITVGIVVNPSEYVADEGLPFLYGGEVKEGFIDVEKARKISPEDSARNRKTMLEAGDIVTMRVGYPGLTAVVPPECAGGNCASVMLVKRGAFDSRWLCAVMNSRLVRQQVEVVQYGAAQKQFNIADAIEFWMFEPPLSEQTALAIFIEQQSQVFEELMEEASSSMRLLKERRSALISAAVTGKIDVRNWQPPARVFSPELEREAV
ncbi:restriction endonuclease subunit S [Pseudomonas sp. ok266]|uniref:restriction endonuclease subunit S n=1 Tax=Pseudomonas sp. ok266 TaxID=1761896 RepID=UPI0008C49832|nr:restriction endonuclease subunit S [Pseudomonas sp. ok266]SEO71457.1 type I restriction enzyme, S subunit [Pseudomonas sp. ok266]